MIKIDLKDSQKQQIEEKLMAFIEHNKIFEKIQKLASYLDVEKFNNTAELLKKIDLNFFLIFGKQSLQECIDEFEGANLTDVSKNNIKKDKLKLIIANGPKGKRLPGFHYFYKKFSDSDEAYDILKIINATVCPYCNRQYTFTVRKGKLKSRPQFDHYFPKSLSPICLFQFITLFLRVLCVTLERANLLQTKYCILMRNHLKAKKYDLRQITLFHTYSERIKI